MIEWEVTFLAIAYLILGLDSFWIDWIVFRKHLRPEPLSLKEIEEWNKLPEKKIFILVPAWKESNIIQRMLRGNLERIDYKNYRFLVGCYPNDLPTFRAIFEVSRETAQVSAFINEQPGPTSKGELLNRMVQEVMSGTFGDFDILLLHDAEDIIHPSSLKLVNQRTRRAGFVQLPVFSFSIPEKLNAGAVYMEEFAESHTRDLLVRDHLCVAIPSAGVGTALTKKAIQKIQSAQRGKLLDESCLTEDYCLGIKAHEIGISQTFACCYLVQENKTKEWIATREYFPRSFKNSVKQKARWIQGITLESVQRLGWFGKVSNRIFLWRDRKTLISNPLGVVGLASLPLLMRIEEIPTAIAWLLSLNGLCFLARFLVRFRSYQQIYPEKDWIFLLIRFPLAILINGTAGFLALKNFLISQVRREPSLWVKTDHEIPVGFGQMPIAGRRSV